jgi:hypothetical protein
MVEVESEAAIAWSACWGLLSGSSDDSEGKDTTSLTCCTNELNDEVEDVLGLDGFGSSVMTADSPVY